MSKPTSTYEQAIRARLAAATEGPWFSDGPLSPGPDDSLVIYPKQGGTIAYVQPSWDDAELIAHAPTDLAALLAELDRLRAELAKAQEVTEDKVERVQKIMIDESFLAHEPDPHIRNVVREGIREQARLHVEAVLDGGGDA